MKTFKRILAAAVAALFCLTACASAQTYAPVELSGDARYAMNLFLSNFTEIGLGSVSTWSDDKTLVDFAHDHMWFNAYDSFEYGEYAGENNCRVSDDRIQSIIDKYFAEPRQVDLSQTRFDYDGEYYYHCETGGWINSGFAQTVSVCPLGDDRYFVSFMTFGGGEFWENDVFSMTIGEAAEKFGEPANFGHAVVRAGNLSDRSTYKMESFN